MLRPGAEPWAGGQGDRRPIRASRTVIYLTPPLSFSHRSTARPKGPNPSLSQEPASPALSELVEAFLADLAHANRSAHTCRAYRSDLARFAQFYTGPADAITPSVLRGFLATRADLAAATRSRTEAALSSFLTQAYRQGYIDANPMGRVERVRLDPPSPRGKPRAQVNAVPAANKRDQVLFRLIAETGLRIGEALAINVEDLDLVADDEHLSIVGKGGRRRTVLLDDDRVVTMLHSFLRTSGYRHGPLFRAEKNGRGGPLRYQSARAHWTRYCDAAGVECTLHQLRHSHGTQLVNDGVSLATIRKRLGHRSIQITLRYAEQSDATSDAELRAWRRKQTRGR